jgi:5-methylthioadenosine/S-adenosylhomocysteine deaminase
MTLPNIVDSIIHSGTVVTMDPAHRILRSGAVAIHDGVIVAVGGDEEILAAYDSDQKIDARRKVIMPGLVDSYGHAGHGLIRAIYHPKLGWPTNALYFHATTPDWWYAEGRLAALERLKFGVTTGFSVIGATPARVDSPIYAARQAQAVLDVGIRAFIGVGPPDPFVSHLPEPWTATHWDGDHAEVRPFTYADTMRNCAQLITDWHGAGDGRIDVALHVPYLFGRQAKHPRIPFEYDIPRHVPVMIEQAEEVRDLADSHNVLLHTHAFRGSIDFGFAHFGAERMERLLRRPLVLAHSNGFAQSEIDAIGAAQVGIAVVPFTHENPLYGACPIIELVRAGAVVSIATDGTAPHTNYDLFKEIPRAINMQWMRFNDQSVLPVGKALRMVTIDAARALGVDDRIGSLEVGKQADVILIDMDQPHLVPDAHVPRLLALYVTGHDVDTVMVGGRLLMQGRKLLHVDQAEILEDARAQAAAAFARHNVDAHLETDEAFWSGAHYFD